MVIFEKDTLRVSLILPDVLRIETGSFTDLPTQTVFFRDFGSVPHTLETKDHLLRVRTDAATFLVDTVKGCLRSVILVDGTCHTDFTSGILPGTARTLDQANGAVKLEKGITSRTGVSMMDDRSEEHT